MEILERLFGRWSKKEQPLPAISAVLKNKPTGGVWPYSYFREYLLALGTGSKFLLPEAQHPDLIELSKDWIDTLHRMNVLTQDEYEYYAPIGYRLLPVERRALLLPTRPFRGSRGSVTPEVQSKARGAVKDIGNEDVLGDIHSHPHRDHLVFSVADMYSLLTPTKPDYVMAVVGDNEFLFGLRTRDTKPSIFARSQVEFCKFWYSQNGYEYVGCDNPNRGEVAHQRTGSASIWDINKKIAQAHRLILYSGDYKNGLVRTFPIKKS